MKFHHLLHLTTCHLSIFVEQIWKRPVCTLVRVTITNNIVDETGIIEKCANIWHC